MAGTSSRSIRGGKNPVVARDLISSLARVSGRTATGDAARTMAGAALTALPVCDENGCLVGLISEHDLLAAALQDPDWQQQPVSRAMHRANGWAVADARAEWVLVEMTETGNWVLPVVDHDQRLLGMVSLLDLAPAIRPPVLVDASLQIYGTVHG